MNLTERVNEDLKTAMKTRDEVKIRSLRSIKSAFLLLQTAEGQAPVTDEACLKALQKLAKQRRDSLEQFRNAGREDLATKEQEELEVLESYLPAQMDEATLRSQIASLIAREGAQGAKDLGKVMPLTMKAFGSVADGKLISALVKELLG
jgi:uncharacterized protein YqeY